MTLHWEQRAPAAGTTPATGTGAAGAPAARRPAADRLDLTLMLILTFATGIVDAIGYLGLDHVFAGNMTGNVVVLGMGLNGADGLPSLGPALALVAFVLGAAAVGRLLRPVQAKGWSGVHTALLVVVGVVLAVAAALLYASEARPVRPWNLVITAMLALAMGAQAATARHVAVKDVTTVVVTSTITSLAADRWRGAERQPWVRRVLAIVGIAAGALAGASLLTVHIGLGPLVAAVLVLAVALVGWVGHRHIDA